MRTARNFWLGLAIGATIATQPIPVHACLWDSDTLKFEAQAFPGIAEILTGRIQRFPPRYYEMRLARVSAELSSLTGAATLDRFDDAGVACDQLGRTDEAIAWMAKKRAVLDALPESTPTMADHRYRYHANLGTFYAHRWLRSGANRADLSDLKAAEAEIVAALKINANAHFGREEYQLAAVQWLIALPEAPWSVPTFLDVMQCPLDGATQRTLVPQDVIKGTSGLIVLGEAWESVDVIFALALALRAHGDGSLGDLADLRLLELLAAGKKSLHPQFEFLEVGHTLSLAYSRDFMPRARLASPYEFMTDSTRSYFAKAREQATSTEAKRWAFMETRFTIGKHPDTDADFWKGWQESEPPPLPEVGAWSNEAKLALIGYVCAGVPTMVTVGIVVFAIRRRRRKVRLANVVEGAGLQSLE